MAEFDEAVALANRVLGRPGGDPDDDLAVLARQFLRAVERAGPQAESKIGPCRTCNGSGLVDRKQDGNRMSARLCPTCRPIESPQPTREALVAEVERLRKALQSIASPVMRRRSES